MFEVAVFARSYIASWMLEFAHHGQGRVLAAISSKVMDLAERILKEPVVGKRSQALLRWGQLAASWALEGFQMSFPAKEPRRVAAEVIARKLKAEPKLSPDFIRAWNAIDIDLKRISRVEEERKRELAMLMRTDFRKFQQLMLSA
eukprot:tig00020903_g15078.t1